MTESNRYIEIMIEGLRKKSVILDAIMDVNNELQCVISATEMNTEQFKELLDCKDNYVKQINQLDEGFQGLFDKIADDMRHNKEKYKQQITDMQHLIVEITDKAVQIQQTESEQRLLIEGQFAKMHKKIRVAKQGMNVAHNYYKSMSKLNVVDSQFLDKKN